MHFKKLFLAASTAAVFVVALAASSGATVRPAKDSIIALSADASQGLNMNPGAGGGVGAVCDWNSPMDSATGIHTKWCRYDSVDFTVGNGDSVYTRLFVDGGAEFWNCGHKLVFLLDSLTGTGVCTLTAAVCIAWDTMRYQPGLVVNQPKGIHNLFMAGYSQSADGTYWSGGILNVHSFIFSMPKPATGIAVPPQAALRSRAIGLTVKKDGISVAMPGEGDYFLTVQRVDGKTLARTAVSNARSAWMPLSAPAGSYLMTIENSGASISKPFIFGR